MDFPTTREWTMYQRLVGVASFRMAMATHLSGVRAEHIMVSLHLMLGATWATRHINAPFNILKVCNQHPSSQVGRTMCFHLCLLVAQAQVWQWMQGAMTGSSLSSSSLLGSGLAAAGAGCGPPQGQLVLTALS